MNALGQQHIRLQTGFYPDWFYKQYGISFDRTLKIRGGHLYIDYFGRKDKGCLRRGRCLRGERGRGCEEDQKASGIELAAMLVSGYKRRASNIEHPTFNVQSNEEKTNVQ
jgi:hypothetical protein